MPVPNRGEKTLIDRPKAVTYPILPQLTISPLLRARNKDKMKPSDIVDGRNTGLKKYLESREYIRFAGSDIIRQDEDDDDDDDLEHNSASDSD